MQLGNNGFPTLPRASARMGCPLTGVLPPDTGAQTCANGLSCFVECLAFCEPVDPFAVYGQLWASLPV